MKFNKAHLRTLREGPEALRLLRAHSPKLTLELSGCDLTGCNLPNATIGPADLQGATIANADWSGVDLHGSNLSGAEIRNVTLHKAILVKLTMNGPKSMLAEVNMKGATIRDVDFSQAQFRSCHLSDSKLRRLKMNGVTLANVIVDGAHLEEVSMERGLVSDCSFKNATLEYSKFSKATIVSSAFDDSVLEGVDFSDATFAGCSFVATRLTACRLARAIAKRFNSKPNVLDRAVVDRTDFDRFIFGDSSITDMRIIAPQGGIFTEEGSKTTANWQGLLSFPRELPAQTIRNATGLAPDVERRICDAQYLRNLARRKGFALEHSVSTKQVRSVWQLITGYLRTLHYRLWGVTSDYGQNFWKWTATCVFIVLVFAGAFMLLKFEVNNAVFCAEKSEYVAQETFLSLDRAIYFSVVTFTTLGYGDISPLTLGGRVMVTLEVIAGYVMLGVLMSIIANKALRLS